MSDAIMCEAQRRGRMWIVSVPEYGVYAHGRSLAVARDNTVAALSLIGVQVRPVEMVPVTPELAAMQAARGAYEAALEDAVVHLAARRTSLRDMAAATELTVPGVKRVLAARAEKTAKSTDSMDGEAVGSVQSG